MSNLKYVGVAAFALTMSLSASAGAWGEGPFDNDDAQDWLIECSSFAGPGTIAEAINAALRPGYLEADAGSVAVAAAEVIAAADGKGPATTNAEACAMPRKDAHARGARLGAQCTSSHHPDFRPQVFRAGSTMVRRQVKPVGCQNQPACDEARTVTVTVAVGQGRLFGFEEKFAR